jgi:hypothetical protein
MSCSTYWQTSDLYMNDTYITSSLSYCPLYPSSSQTAIGPYPLSGKIEVCCEDGSIYIWISDRVEKWYPPAANGDQLKEIWLNPLKIQKQLMTGAFKNSFYTENEKEGIYARIEGKEYTWILDYESTNFVSGLEYRFHTCSDGLLHTEEEYYEETREEAMCPCRLENYKDELAWEEGRESRDMDRLTKTYESFMRC